MEANNPTVTWRDIARPIIYQVLKDTAGWEYKEIRRSLRDAYPFGERKYYPYKVWCDEINRQLRRGKYARTIYRKTKRAISIGENQLTLFKL